MTGLKEMLGLCSAVAVPGGRVCAEAASAAPLLKKKKKKRRCWVSWRELLVPEERSLAVARTNDKGIYPLVQPFHSQELILRIYLPMQENHTPTRLFPAAL